MNKDEIQARLERTLARYVAMPTVPTDIPACTEAIADLAEELKQIGMFVEIGGPMHPWLIATTTKEALAKKRVKILFATHFDVVPPTDEHQLVMRVTDTKIAGRGVYDMKFAAAVSTELVRDLAREGTLQDYDMGILLTTDEEKGGYDGALEFLQEGWRSDLAIVADGGDSWQLEGRAKGISYVYLRATGKSAHSSRPWEGDNPLHKLAPVIHEIAERFADSPRDGVAVSMNTLQSSGGHVLNTTRIPDWANCGISVRAFTPEETENAIVTIEKIAAKYDVEVERTLDDPGVLLDRENPLVQAFIKASTAVHGQPLDIVDANGASDARHFSRFDIPSVLMYLEGDGFHGPEEWINRTDLYKYYDLCRRYVTDVAYTPGATKKAPALAMAGQR